MAEEIEVGKLSIPVEADLRKFDEQVSKDLKERAERAGREAGKAIKDTIASEAKGAGESVAAEVRASAAAVVQAAAAVGAAAGEEVKDAVAAGAAGAGETVADEVRKGAGAAADAGADVGTQIGQSITESAEDAVTSSAARVGEAVSHVAPSAERAARVAGERAGQGFADGIERRFELAKADITEALARGLITTREAEARGQEAGRAYKQALLAEIKNRANAGTLTDRDFVDLTGRLRAAGEHAGEELNQGMRSGVGALLPWLKGIFAIQVSQLIGRAIRGGVNYLRESAAAAAEVTQSYLRLSSASKLYGVDQQTLNDLSRRGRVEMNLSASAANELATNAAKIAGRAGEAARAQELWAAALDLGAANGMKANEVALALDQSFRGMDEGLNRLGLSDPGQLFKEWADSAGRTVESMTDAEKQMAILTAITAAGAKVQGEYGRQLEGDVGKLNDWQMQMQRAREEIGDALLPVIVKLTQTLEGPLSAGVRIVTSLLEGMLTPTERLARQMERLGMASELVLPLTLQDRIKDTKREMRELEEELGELSSTGNAEARGYAGLSGTALAAKRRELLAEGARAAAGGDVTTAQAMNYAVTQIDRIIAKQRELSETNRNLTATEREYQNATQRRDLRMELNTVNDRIEAISGETVLTQALVTELNNLYATREKLEGQLGVSEAAPPTSTGGDTGAAALTKAELARQAAKAKAEAERMEAAREQLETRIREFRTMEDAGVPALDSQASELPALLQQVISLDREIRAIEEQIAAARSRAPEGAAALLAAYRTQRDAAAAAARAMSEGVTENLARINDLRAGIASIAPAVDAIAGKAVSLGEGGFSTVTAGIDGVSAALREATEAQNELTRAQLAGDPERIADARKRQEAAERAVAAASQRAMKIFETGAETGAIRQDELNALIAEMVRLLTEAGVSTDDLTSKGRDWEGIAETIEGVARGVMSVADALGIVDDQSRKALQGLVDVASAAGRIAANPGDVGAWVQGIGGLIGVVSGLMGGGDEEAFRAHAENLQSTYRLVRALDDLRGAVLTDMTERERSSLESQGGAIMGGEVGRILGAYAPGDEVKFGGGSMFRDLSQGEFDFFTRLEEATDIDFFDPETMAVKVGAFRDAWAAFLEMDVGSFGEGVQGRLDAFDFAIRMAGDTIGDATARMDLFIRTLEAIPDAAGFATEFRRILEGEGEEAARKWLESQAILYAQAGAAALPWATDLDPAEIERILSGAGTALDGFTDSVNKATGSLSNVPELFDLALRKRQAAMTAPEAGPTPGWDAPTDIGGGGSIPTDVPLLAAVQSLPANFSASLAASLDTLALTPWAPADIAAILQNTTKGDTAPVVRELERLRAAVAALPAGGDVTLNLTVQGGTNPRETAEATRRVVVDALKHHAETKLAAKQAVSARGL